MSVHACSVCAEPFPPGTNSRWKTCPPCAKVRKTARTLERRRAAALTITGDEEWHGTSNGYTNHRCRCSACRDAYNVYHDEWRKRPDVLTKRREAAKLASRTPHRRHQKRAYFYGLTVDSLAEMLSRRACDACGAEVEPNKLNVDHDHACCPAKTRSCGKCVRGVLCRQCNLTLGAAGDDASRLTALIGYLERAKR